MNLFKCGNCGYIADELPEKCPKCGFPKEQFSDLKEDEEKLVLRSRLTNDMHMEVSGILDNLLEISEEGIKDALDPNCVLIFERLKKDSWEIKQSIKAELETHMKKGKWG
jgi:rubredoxin